MIKIRNTGFVLLLFLLCCRKPYTPPATSTSQSYLVVEGVIDSGNDSTIIKLSKTVMLTQGTTNPLLGAVVTVEGNQGASYPLLDVNNTGIYKAAPLGLSASQKYRIRIVTGSKQYVSDFIAPEPTPPIDSIGYTTKDTLVTLYVNTHDPLNATRYYRWDYGETWIFHSKYLSEYVLDTATSSIVLRTPAQQVYSCFAKDSSSNILLTSTAALSKDIVYQSPLTQIPFSSEKFTQKYSILVKQYALTGAAYEFYVNLKTSTEQLGSIFDAEPSQLNGNIHNVADATEPVIGYMTVTNVQSKRIFLTNAIVPKYQVVQYPYACEVDTTGGPLNTTQDVLIDPPLTDIPTLSIGGGNYLYSTPQCVDCTLRGTTQTPSFWK
jgi:hypothetical protein